MSNLIDHAQRELDLIGMLDGDADYGARVGRDVLALIGHFASQGHSGGSAGSTIHLFGKLAAFEPLSEITSYHAEWMQMDANVGGPNLWQSVRKPSVFSKDAGATYYDLDEALDKYQQRVIHTSNKPSGRRLRGEGHGDEHAATGAMRDGITVTADGATRTAQLGGEGPRMVPASEALRRIADGVWSPSDNRLALLAGANALEELERMRAGCVNEKETRPA